MKILHWLNTFLPDVGGIQTFTANLLPFQEEQGHELLLIADDGFRGASAISSHAGVPVHRFNMIRSLLKRNPGDLLRTKIAIQKLIKEFDPDVIHMQPSGPELIYANQIFQSIHKPLVVTMQASFDSVELQSGIRSGFGAFLSQADQMTAVSKDVKAWINLAFENLNQELTVIENAVPPRPMVRKALPWNPPMLLSLCRLDPQKNLGCLLRAFQIVIKTHPRAHLTLAGSGVEEEMLKGLSSQLGLDDSTTFKGWVEPSDVSDLLNQTTIFVSSSNYEGLSLSALEAGQMARPIVTTAVDGMSDVVLDGHTGYLVEPNNHVEMADQICQLLCNPAQAQAFGDAGQKHVEARFGMARAAAKYEQIYQAAILQKCEVVA